MCIYTISERSLDDELFANDNKHVDCDIGVTHADLFMTIRKPPGCC
jgi:hypothetical protein